jgi:hypothetical protein
MSATASKICAIRHTLKPRADLEAPGRKPQRPGAAKSQPNGIDRRDAEGEENPKSEIRNNSENVESMEMTLVGRPLVSSVSLPSNLFQISDFEVSDFHAPPEIYAACEDFQGPYCREGKYGRPRLSPLRLCVSAVQISFGCGSAAWRFAAFVAPFFAGDSGLFGSAAPAIAAAILPCGAFPQKAHDEENHRPGNDQAYRELIEDRIHWKPRSLPP